MSSSSSPASSASSSTSLSSVSSSASSVHPASLVDAALHSPHTLRLVNIKISKQLIDHVVDQVIDTVEYAMGKASSSSSSTHHRGRRTRTPLQTKFTTFASTVLTRAEITTPTLLSTLIYISRARPFLHIALEEWALERVFLGALITASKYLNDSTLKNVHWALCTGVFGKRDVGRIEREFLAVLDWELGITEGEVLGLWEGLEWAVEEEEREERRVRERTERKQRERAAVALAASEHQPKKFYVSPAPKTTTTHSRSSSLESNASDSLAPPPVPPKSARNHHRRTHAPPAPVHIIPSLPHLSHSSSSPASSASSSSSSSNSSSPRTPSTPGYDLAYPEPEELRASQPSQRPQPHHHHQQQRLAPPQIYVQEADAMDVDEAFSVPPPTEQKRSAKRSFGATTMELLKSFPFPGHHSHSHSHSHHGQQQQQHGHGQQRSC